MPSCLDTATDRRQAIKLFSTFTFSSRALASHVLDRSSGRKWKLGMIADLHGGLAPDAPQRLATFLAAMHGAECDALVQLGDFAYPQ